MTKIANATPGGLSIAEMIASPTPLTNTNTPTALFSAVIPAGYMGISKRARFTLKSTMTTAVSLNPTLTLAVSYGGSSFTIISAATLATSITGGILDIEGEFVNQYATNAQLLTINVVQGTAAIPLVTLGLTSRQRASWTEDSTAQATFAVTATFGTASTNASISYYHGTLELS